VLITRQNTGILLYVYLYYVLVQGVQKRRST